MSDAPLMEMRLEDARGVARRVREAELDLRNSILAAHRAGATYEAIGEAVGLTKQRIGQIVKSNRGGSNA